MKIRAMQADDWEQVSEIYAQGIAGRNATFETSVPDWESWDEKHLDIGRLVAVDGDNNVLGWIVLSPISHREAYRGVTEDTIYIANSAQGQGVGSALMQALVDATESAGIWTIYAVTFQENKASIALHEKFGFRMLGYRDRVAKLDGVWRSTVILERRSEVVGND